MTIEVSNMLAGVATVIDTVPGLRVATSLPPETMPSDPAAIVFLIEGNFPLEPLGSRMSLTDIAIDTLVRRNDLPRNLAVLNPFLDAIPYRLQLEISDQPGYGGKFGNTMQTFGQITVTLLPNVDYSGVQMIGYRFVMEECKILVNL